jgi:uncharacterized protein (TIGR01777 family)
MNILIAGGGGFLGQVLDRHFSNLGHSVVILTRGRKAPAVWSPSEDWDGRTLGPWTGLLEDTDVLINLSGRSVDCRYTPKNRRDIFSSRLEATRILGEAVAACPRPPKLWINASSATIYRDAEERAMDEVTGELGHGFSVEVCRQWEKTFFDAPIPDTVRRVALRTSIVLGRDGGAMVPLRNLARLGLGGRQGSGRQYVSWLHEADFAGIVEHVIANEAISGPINATAPTPLSNREFMGALREACRVPLGLPTPRWLLAMGALIIRTETELVLKSRRVIPVCLSESGYCFRFSELREALADLTEGAKEDSAAPCEPSGQFDFGATLLPHVRHQSAPLGPGGVGNTRCVDSEGGPTVSLR